MKLLLTILVLVIVVSAIAFWKDIKNLSAKRKKASTIGNKQYAMSKANGQISTGQKDISNKENREQK